MSQEKVLETLVKIGLRRPEAKVYVFLAKRGALKARDAAKALKMSKQQLYLIIKSLQRKGIVNATLEHPARFSAVPFENVLDFFVKAKIEQAQLIKQSKAGILSDWRSIATESDSPPAKFTVIEGRAHIYAKIQQMAQNAKESLSFVATVPGLARANQFGFFDTPLDDPSKSKIQLRFVTELHGQNMNAVKTLLNRIPKRGFNLIGKTPDLGLKLCPQMVIRDKEETVFFIGRGAGKFESEQDDVCLWTNCRSLVCAFLAMFEDLWRNSANIELKINEIETGRLPPQTQIIRDAETASEKYHYEVDSAENEMLIMTSAEGLVEFWKSMKTVRECTQRGVSIKIMAPITNENLEPARQLSRHCEIRHVSAGYLGATIIDRKHLFQFKEHPIGQAETGQIGYFKNTFYTNDSDYVKKNWNMLQCIWNSALTPSTLTLDEIVGNIGPTLAPLSVKTRNYIKKVGSYTILNEKPPGAITEKDVLNKIIHAKKYPVKDVSKDVDRLYATTGLAVVHPPDYFNFPDIMISAFHVDKQSSLGEEDALMIYLWLKTPKGYTYVPVAIVGDNPEAQEHWKKSHLGTPAGKNVQLLKKDEIQIRVHGNNLFAAWAVPIQLYPSRYVLPPACLLLEAHGAVKTVAYTVVPPSGFRSVFEQNYFDAFVTFMHPSSKYQGPGTDGFFVRDLIATTYPPDSEHARSRL